MAAQEKKQDSEVEMRQGQVASYANPVSVAKSDEGSAEAYRKALDRAQINLETQ